MTQHKTAFMSSIFVVLWSSGWIGSKFGQAYTGTFTLLSYRYILVVIMLLVFVTYTKSWRSVPPRTALLHGCVGVLSHAVYLGCANNAFALGVSAGMVAFVAALQPIMTATVSSSIAREHVSHRQWLGLGLGLAAIFLVVADKIALGGSLLAYILLFISIISISIASLIDRTISLRHQKQNTKYTPLSMICLIHCSSALLVIVPVAALLEGFESEWGHQLVYSILWLAVVVSIGAYGLMFFLLRRVSAVEVACLVYLVPPTTMFIAYFVFDESISWIDCVGLCLAATAVSLITSSRNLTVLYKTQNNS